MANKKYFTSVRQMLSSGELLYPTAHVVKYGKKIYPSIRKASKAEGVSTSHIKHYCKIYTREEIREIVISQIHF